MGQPRVDRFSKLRREGRSLGTPNPTDRRSEAALAHEEDRSPRLDVFREYGMRPAAFSEYAQSQRTRCLAAHRGERADE